MINTTSNDAPTAADLPIALTDSCPDASYGAVPVPDQNDAREGYRAFDDGDLAEVPQALAAYVGHQQHASF